MSNLQLGVSRILGRSAVARRIPFASIGATMLSAALLAWVALLNHYPLLFNDTGRYLDGGIRHYIPSEAPIFYGIFMIPLHWDGWSLWPVLAAQCLLLAYLLRVTLRVLGLLEEKAYLALSAFLVAFTGAPWFADFLMPDFFTAITVLSLFALFRGWEKFGRGERLFLMGIALIALSSHVTHILIGLGLAMLFVILSLWRPAHRPIAPMLVVILPLVALASVMGINLVAKGRPLLTQDGNVFLFARAFTDGPAEQYLRDNCDAYRWSICDVAATLPHNAEDILWGTQGSVWTAGPRDEVRAEAAAIVRGTMLTHPKEVLAAALHNGFAQLLTFRAGVDFGSWGEDSEIVSSMRRFFPHEFAPFMQSLQQQGKLDPTGLNRVYGGVILFSLLGSIVILVLLRFEATITEFMLVIAAALFGNAIATGAFSAVHDRYQARLIWLIPLTFAISVLFLRRQREAPMPPFGDEAVAGKA